MCEDTFALPAGFESAAARIRLHGLRFLLGLRVTDGELVGVGSESVAVVAAGLGLAMGNANVGDAKADDVADAVGVGDDVTLEGEELGTGVGVDGAGMTFSQ